MSIRAINSTDRDAAAVMARYPDIEGNCFICHPPVAFADFVDTDHVTGFARRRIGFVACAAHSREQVETESHNMELRSQALGVPSQYDTWKLPRAEDTWAKQALEPELILKIIKTMRSMSTKPGSKKIPYRKSDRLVQRLLAHPPRLDLSGGRQITLPYHQVKRLFYAFTQIQVATQALENARNVFEKMSSNERPRKTIEMFTKEIGLLTRKMLQLAQQSGEDVKEPAPRQCSEAQDKPDLAILPYLAALTAEDDHPQQGNEIRKYLDQWWIHGRERRKHLK